MRGACRGARCAPSLPAGRFTSTFDLMLHPISWSAALPHYLAALTFGYLLGSIPFGLLLTRLAGTADMLKGTAAVLVMSALWGRDHAMIAALGAFLGHLFPVWLGFKGGKGVATSGGILLAYAWPVGLAAIGTWLVIAALTRYSSLAALVTAVLSPLYAWLLPREFQPTEVVAFLSVIVILRHHANIRRLVRGEEGKISLGN